MKIVLISTDESIAAVGLRILSSCLREAGFFTQIVLLPTDRTSYQRLDLGELYQICKDASLIGISCMTHGITKAIELNSLLKNQFDIPIVIGGIHATLAPESLYDSFDLICHGEGEDIIVELAERIKQKKDYSDIPGLWVKKNNTFIKNNDVPLKRSLNDYPFPDYNFDHQYILKANKIIPMKATYVNTMADGFVVLGSRGCPHHCTYCCNQSLKDQFPWMKNVRHYSVDYLIRHLTKAKNIFPGIKRFWIEDDTFFLKSLPEITEFANRYKEKIQIPFYVLISPETFNEEKLKILIKAGMNALIMGIQSGSENVNFNIYKRKTPNSQILKITQILNKYPGILPCYDFIGMNPFETDQDLAATIRLMRSIPPPFLIFNNNLAFYPGTQLYKKALESRLSLDGRVQHSDASIGYKILTKKDINNKIFHLILLFMAGKANRRWFGHIPRFAVSEGALSCYLFINNRSRLFSDLTITLISTMILVALALKKILLSLLKNILGHQRYDQIKNAIKKR